MAKFIGYLYEYGDQSCSLLAGGSVTRGGGVTMPIFDGGLAGSSLVWDFLFLFPRSRVLIKSIFQPFSLLGFFFVDKNKIGLKSS